MPLVLFETTESVIEVLWDIALAFFIVRIALIYFLLTFSSGALLSWALYSQLLPRPITIPQAELAVLPLQVLLMTMWARFLIAYYEIPRVTSFRVAIGAVACVLVMWAEVVLGLFLWEEGMGEWLAEMDWWWVGGSLLFFAGLPVLLMGVEERVDVHPETRHGHEKKSVLDAVPTVSKTDKDESRKAK